VAAPTVGAAGTYRQGVASATVFANPGSVVANSVVVGAFYVDSSTTISSLPSGFAHAPGSPLRIGAGLGGEHSINVIWKRASGSESADYTVTLSASQYSNGRFFRIDGCVTTGDPWDTNSGTGTAVATDITNGTLSPAVSMTTQNNDQLGWLLTSNWNGGAWTPPSGWTEQMDNGDETCTVDTKALTTAGATGTVQATCAGSNKRGAWLGSLLSTAVSGGGATVTPSTVAAVAALPAPTLKAGSAPTPATVAAVAALPAPTLKAGSAPTPATVAAVAALPAPTLKAGSAPAPATVAAVAAVGTATLSTGQIVSAVTVAAVAALPAPVVTAGGGATVAPATVAAVGGIGAPTLAAGQTVAAVTVAAVASLPAVTVRLSVLIAPATVAAVGGVGAVAVTTSGNALVLASTVRAFAAVGAAVVSAHTVTPAPDLVHMTAAPLVHVTGPPLVHAAAAPLVHVA